jgi:hypothetical protein
VKIEGLAHVLRAARAITGETVFVLLGSQAVLAQFPEAPEILLRSNEIDLYPKFRPDLAEVIEGAMGAGSPFHGAFGYHADGIGPETAILPTGWEARAITLDKHPSLEGAIGICPEIHDLAASKLVAFREKDRDWVTASISAGLVACGELAGLLDHIPPAHAERVATAQAWLGGLEECSDVPAP